MQVNGKSLLFNLFIYFKFFSQQEPKTDKDDSYCRKVNEYLNNPPTPGSGGGRGGGNLGKTISSCYTCFFLSNNIGL